MKSIEAFIKSLFEREGIEALGALPFGACRIINQRKLSRLDFVPKSAIVFLVPYRSGEYPDRTVSLYALARDYHIFFREVGEKICDSAKTRFPDNHFERFADSSPIDERKAALDCGLGVKCESGLIASERYGTYVFIGEILCDLEYDKIEEKPFEASDVRLCPGCGKCKEACPAKDGECQSALTQKKGDLTEDEREKIRSGLCWGCDVCQEVCPLNSGREYSPIPFFSRDLIERPTLSLIDSMSEEELSQRAWSWRGVDVIRRNLIIRNGK